MTKKHFIALADAMRATKPSWPEAEGNEQWERDLRSIAAFCAAQNPRFNRERWIGYIKGTNGPSGGAIKPCGAKLADLTCTLPKGHTGKPHRYSAQP